MQITVNNYVRDSGGENWRPGSTDAEGPVYDPTRPGDETSLSLATIKSVEGNRTEPRSDTLVRIADALNVTPGFVLTGNNEEGESITPRSRALMASFRSLRRMNQAQLEEAEELLRVLAELDEEDSHTPKKTQAH